MIPQLEDWLKVIFLGIVEGVTEFLPISSTGHLILSAELVQLQDNLSGTFEIFIQIGAVMAVLFYYRIDFWNQIRSVRHSSKTRQLWLAIVVAFIPAAILGLMFDDFIETQLVTGEFAVIVVACSLIVGGIMFLIAEHLTHETPQPDEIQSLVDAPLTLKQALIVGMWQVLALIPGMSRSGMSILGGMFAGTSRQVATQFSFYLAVPTLGGATVYTLLKNISQFSSSDLVFLGLGAVVAGLVAWLSIDWLLRYISKHSFVVFGYYRIGIGILILILALSS